MIARVGFGKIKNLIFDIVDYQTFKQGYTLVNYIYKSGVPGEVSG